MITEKTCYLKCINNYDKNVTITWQFLLCSKLKSFIIKVVVCYY